MSDLLWALSAAVSMAVMYVVCLRSMRRGRGHCATTTDPAREELARLRKEVAELRERTRVG